MVTINPADCDRTTVYAGEFRNYSDTAWVQFQSGRRRAPDAPDYPWLVDSGTGSFWTRDTHVRNLVRLVPAEDDADRWRRAHSIVAQSYRVDACHATERAEAAERERDEAQERADQLRDERDDAVQSCIAVGRARDEWRARAEAAEARTAVTREDVEKAIRGKVWAVNRGPNKAGFHRVHVDWATDAVCDLFGIEAEPADPVEELARQIEAATRTAIRQVCDDLATVAPSLDPLAVERAMEVTAASRKVAAHVLGKEASDE